MLEYKSDFEMSVPFGTIRGKIWHHPDRGIEDDTIRVLALHGWQDNCGTFDTLIPLLPSNFYIVAIDFPGHGLSSHLPPGCPYNDTIFVLEVERIIQYLQWKNEKTFTILGHSMGAAIGMFYSCLYPESVDCIISLDMIKPLTFPSDKLASKTREGIEQFLHLESKICQNNNGNGQSASSASSSIPLYDEQEAIQKLILAHSVFGKITIESAKILLKRGSKTISTTTTNATNENSENDSLSKKKIYFTRDNRLKALLFQRMDNDALIHYFKQLNCKLLIIKAKNGVKLDPEDVSERYLKVYEKNCKKFEFALVPGGHHVHLCQPENVYKKILDFISNNDSNNTTTNGDANNVNEDIKITNGSI